MSKIKLFESKKIRSIWSEQDQKWYFSVIDVVEALTDSPNPRDYWYRIKQREKIGGMELSTICRQFKLDALDGKSRETDCAHTEGLLRIIQSIPSPKAEPFKRWLAQVGYERLEEIENPELAAARQTRSRPRATKHALTQPRNHSYQELPQTRFSPPPAKGEDGSGFGAIATRDFTVAYPTPALPLAGEGVSVRTAKNLGRNSQIEHNLCR